MARRAAHHDAVHRALNAVEDADARVDVLRTRLRTAEAAALVLRLSSGDEHDRLDGELRDVSGSLAAVGRALLELEA